MRYAHNKPISWLTVHGVVNGSMIHPGVTSSKISNVSSSFSNSNVTSSISCSASLRELVKYCIDSNHKNATITCRVHMDDPSFCHLTCFMVSRFFDTAKIHSCSSVFTFCVNVDALYTISREHTVNSNRPHVKDEEARLGLTSQGVKWL